MIWDFAKSIAFTILTKDSDFVHMSDVRGAPPKVIWLRVGNARTQFVADLVRRHLGDLLIFDADPFVAQLIIDL